MIGKRKDSILNLGKALEKVLKINSICEEIKNILDDEIKQGIISRRLIEDYCLPQWKKKTRPKRKRERRNFVLSTRGNAYSCRYRG